jgi:hypothetical protein
MTKKKNLNNRTKEQVDQDELFIDFCQLFNIKVDTEKGIASIGVDKIPDIIKYLQIVHGMPKGEEK